VADRRGDFPNVPGEFGFYFADTRFLSLLELRLHGLRGIALNAGVSDDALEAAIDLTNPTCRCGRTSCCRDARCGCAPADDLR